jgi:hypothetical protein
MIPWDIYKYLRGMRFDPISSYQLQKIITLKWLMAKGLTARCSLKVVDQFLFGFRTATTLVAFFFSLDTS